MMMKSSLSFRLYLTINNKNLLLVGKGHLDRLRLISPPEIVESLVKLRRTILGSASKRNRRMSVRSKRSQSKSSSSDAETSEDQQERDWQSKRRARRAQKATTKKSPVEEHRVSPVSRVVNVTEPVITLDLMTDPLPPPPQLRPIEEVYASRLFCSC